MAQQKHSVQDLKQKACSFIDEAKEKLHRLSKDIWSCPELAYEEKKAHDRLVRFFTEEETGWKVDSHYKLDTAFRATWGLSAAEEGSHDDVINVGFLCEYDALPDIGHACGHNLIAEVGAAAAVGLKALVEEHTHDFPARVQVRWIHILK